MKLTYFNLYGKVEAIRMLLHHSKTEYENCHVSGESFQALKQSGYLPNGQVPVFEIEGKVMNQSQPILRYLGAIKGYYNSQDADAAYEADWVLATIDERVAPAETNQPGCYGSRYQPVFHQRRNIKS